MYAGAQRQGLGAGYAQTLAPIAALTPNPVPAGPGQQVVIVQGQGLQQGFNLSISPNDPTQLTNPSAQGYGGALYDVSADGTTAKALIDLLGNVASWSANITSPYTNELSPQFMFSSVAGAPVPVNMNDYQAQSGQLRPILVQATTQVVQGRNAQGQLATANQVTGGVAMVPPASGAPVQQTFSGPGVLVNQSGAWQFTPAGAAARAIVDARFPGLVDVSQPYDAFGLPIDTPARPATVSWIDSSGRPVTSPWSTAPALPAFGSAVALPIAQPVILAPTTDSGASSLYQSPAAPAPLPTSGTAPASSAPVSSTPLYQPIVTVPVTATPSPVSSAPTDLYQSAASNAPAPVSSDSVPAGPADINFSGLGVVAVIVGAVALALTRKRGRGTQTWQ